METIERLHLSSQQCSTLTFAARDNAPVSGFTHDFYRYPARFSPRFVRAAILTFTDPGETVVDPFMGGGTAIVEALVSGRMAVGFDVNSLAVFVTRAKTTFLRGNERSTLLDWFLETVPKTKSILHPSEQGAPLRRNVTNLDGSFWRLRALIGNLKEEIKAIPNVRAQTVARAVLLRTAQWAIDCRADIPSVADFRSKILNLAFSMSQGSVELTETTRASWKKAGLPLARPYVANISAGDAQTESYPGPHSAPKLVITSPPYPGVHVLYHRWQVLGRRETNAPYWISETRDGMGASYYTFGDRKRLGLGSYFQGIEDSFRRIRAICDQGTVVVQLLAFSNAEEQLPRYLRAMNTCGFREKRLRTLKESPDGRLWRRVPNRKWYARNLKSDSSQEVVLFHSPI